MRHPDAPPAGRRRLALLTASLAVAIGALPACGSDAGTAGEPTSPLGDFFGWSDVDAVESQRQQLETEELTVDCMREEGFEYVPQDFGDDIDTDDPDADLYDDPEAFGAKYGYGIVHGYEQWDVDNIEAQESGEPPPGSDWVDPNQDYIDSLSPNEQTVYFETLYGKSQEWEVDADGNEIEPPPLPMEDRGCQSQSSAQVVGPSPWDVAGFSTRFDELQRDSEDDPRLADNSAEWAQCMGDALDEYLLPDGRTVDAPADMYTYFDGEKVLATGQQILPVDPDTGEPIGADLDDDGGWSSTINADGTGWAYVGEQHLIPADQLERLRTRELEAWRRDFDCQDEVGTAEVRRLIEQETVDILTREFPEIGATS